MFSADLSWTDQHDQISRNNRGRASRGSGRSRPKSYASSESSLPPSYRIPASRDAETPKSSNFFRKITASSSRSSESSSRSSSGNGAHSQNSKFGEDILSSPLNSPGKASPKRSKLHIS